jgi:CRP/FNR family cyclic AMP-dependent transcriptional regulator
MRTIATAPHDGASNNLEGCSFLAGLSSQDLKRNCPAATMHTFRHGSTIYTQGERCGDLFCVLSGQVKLARVNDEGNELTTGLLTTGELFGPALGGSDSLEAEETAMTKGTVSVWRVPAKEFRNLLLHHSSLCLRVIEALARRQRQMERRLECFAFKRTEARLAKTLRELSGGFETRCEHGFGQHIRLTQQELADLVGASRPVVSTILNRLRKKGVLGYNREYLCVRAIEAIEDLMGT